MTDHSHSIICPRPRLALSSSAWPCQALPSRVIAIRSSWRCQYFFLFINSSRLTMGVGCGSGESIGWPENRVCFHRGLLRYPLLNIRAVIGFFSTTSRIPNSPSYNGEGGLRNADPAQQRAIHAAPASRSTSLTQHQSHPAPVSRSTSLTQHQSHTAPVSQKRAVQTASILHETSPLPCTGV